MTEYCSENTFTLEQGSVDSDNIKFSWDGVY